jgi:hypothetical protein
VKCDSIFNFTCPHVTILILGENDMSFLPLTSKGCVGYVNVKMGDAMKFGRNTDLSRFGANMYQWQEVEVKVSQKLAIILINGEQILELPFQRDIGNIVGFNFNFTGAGSIDYVTLMDQTGTKAYSTGFGSGSVEPLLR